MGLRLRPQDQEAPLYLPSQPVPPAPCLLTCFLLLNTFSGCFLRKKRVGNPCSHALATAVVWDVFPPCTPRAAAVPCTSPSVLPALLQVAAAWLLWSSSFLLLTFRCSHSLPLFQSPDLSSLSASCGGGSWKFLPVACRSRAWWSLAPGLKVDSLYKTRLETSPQVASTGISDLSAFCPECTGTVSRTQTHSNWTLPWHLNWSFLNGPLQVCGT